MSAERATMGDPRIDEAVTELKEMIRERYPKASFATTHGDDPEGVYLTAIVDVEDTEEVFDVVVDRLLAMEIEEGLPIYVVAVRPPERVLQERDRLTSHCDAPYQQ